MKRKAVVREREGLSIWQEWLHHTSLYDGFDPNDPGKYLVGEYVYMIRVYVEMF